MRLVVLVAVILLSGASGAYAADNDVWTNIRKAARGDDLLNLDVDYCAGRLGRPQSGGPTSPQFKRCMLGRGWRFSHTIRDDRYPDPDNPGLMCHDFKIGGITGSDCSNF